MVVKSESVMGEILKKLPCEPPEIGGILGGKKWSGHMPCLGLRKDGRFSVQLYAKYCVFEPEDRGMVQRWN